MDEQQYSLQLDRIVEIQERLRQIVTDETLDQLEELVTELSSRIITVRQGIDSGELAGTATGERLAVILTEQTELFALSKAKLANLGDRLIKAQNNSMISGKYTIEPARVSASLLKSTDIIG